jgi:hypothetical protein
MHRVLVALGVLLAAAAMPCAAQEGTPRPGLVEGHAGYTGFGDDGIVHHVTAGTGVRWRLAPRIHVGPEIMYMVGPGRDRDVFLTGTLTFDLLAGDRLVTPYLLANGGFMFSSLGLDGSLGAFSLGGGARIRVSERFFVAPEARLGNPPQIRGGLSVGYRF